ncbi:MAG: hypothetical protein Q9225_007123 [Loekoesia sp. 1 TL-2023]
MYYQSISTLFYLLFAVTITVPATPPPFPVSAPTRYFNLRIRNTDLFLRGCYTEGEDFKLPEIPLVLCLRSIYNAVSSHIVAAGDGPLVSPENPIAQVILASPYWLIIDSDEGKLTYGNVRDVVDERGGVGYYIRTDIGYHAFQAEIVRGGERLGLIRTEIAPSARGGSMGALESAVDALAAGCLKRVGIASS